MFICFRFHYLELIKFLYFDLFIVIILSSYLLSLFLKPLSEYEDFLSIFHFHHLILSLQSFIVSNFLLFLLSYINNHFVSELFITSSFQINLKYPFNSIILINILLEPINLLNEIYLKSRHCFIKQDQRINVINRTILHLIFMISSDLPINVSDLPSLQPIDLLNLYRNRKYPLFFMVMLQHPVIVIILLLDFILELWVLQSNLFLIKIT